MDWITVILCLLLVIILWKLNPRRPSDFPNGPPLLPVIANLPIQLEMGRRGRMQVIRELSEKYGDIFSMIFPGGMRIVIINNLDLIKEAFSQRELSGRPSVFTSLYRTFKKKQGIIGGDGADWHEHRNFVLRNLRNMGMGKRSLEDVIQAEALHLADHFSKHAGRPVALEAPLGASFVNTLYNIIAQRRFDDLDDPELRQIVHSVDGFFLGSGNSSLANLMPWLRHIFPNWKEFKVIRESRDLVCDLFRPLIAEHKQTRVPDQPRDLIDIYLDEMDKPDAAERRFDDEMLLVVMMDLFMAGIHTVNFTLQWILLYMLHYPEVQSRIHRELDEVVGRDRLPTLDDRNRLHFTEATILEVSRMASLANLAVGHETLVETKVGPYVLPRGTMVLSNLHAVHHDPAYWEDPETFRPERFLDDQGRFVANERVLPFGFGQRRCVGESLARHELSLFFSILLHRFQVCPADATQLPTLEPISGVTLNPQPFQVIFRERRKEAESWN